MGSHPLILVKRMKGKVPQVSETWTLLKQKHANKKKKRNVRKNLRNEREKRRREGRKPKNASVVAIEEVVVACL